MIVKCLININVVIARVIIKKNLTMIDILVYVNFYLNPQERKTIHLNCLVKKIPNNNELFQLVKHLSIRIDKLRKR